jgi:hypothetical protein
VDALRTLHQSLVPGGWVVDTQPLSPRPEVFAAGQRIGTLDMRDWARTIELVDAEIERALAAGLFVLEAERRIVVTDSFDSGVECLEEVREWGGTKVPKSLEKELRAAHRPAALEQEVKIRLLTKPFSSASVSRGLSISELL